MLSGIWDSRQLTNGGKYHELLEAELAKWLDVEYISIFTNGTLPLIVALQALGVEPPGEVITTPYSFVATSHAIAWSGLTPVFADVERETCNLSVEKAQSLVTARTKAILPVHVYGHPCDVEGFERLGNAYGLPVLYDAAHAFGVKYKGKSVLEYGDMSTLSFHATKIFNTAEGGAIVCRSAEMKRRIDKLRNFGFAGETSVVGIGLNGKMDELRAALGLLNLRQVHRHIACRRELVELYNKMLSSISGITTLPIGEEEVWNYSHYPVFVDEKVYGCSRDRLYEELRACGLNGRRYFYPLITDFEPYKTQLQLRGSADRLPVARAKADGVICLPLFPDMRPADVEAVVSIIVKNCSAHEA